MVSTARATSRTTRQECGESRLSSTTMSNMGSVLRSGRVLRSSEERPRRRDSARASMSESVTRATPPTRSASSLLRTSPARSPCALAMMRTPRILHVRAASTSLGRPISSTTMTEGVWFCTHSTMTDACSASEGTCIRRARPRQACGTSAGPPSSHDVSTTRTFCLRASSQAASRITVDLPQPGSPTKRMLLSDECRRSATMAATPAMCRPKRSVAPTTSFWRLRMAETRCSVPTRPPRLSWHSGLVRARIRSRSQVERTPSSGPIIMRTLLIQA
mmetsp:Transcript_28776/g.96987  ORF Transcript_28776/g.96987 Transcript_28776/m.96987 type:complete len:275 (+) Transcript_28776:152-976(+)